MEVAFQISGLALGAMINITVGVKMLLYTHFTGVPRGTFIISQGPNDSKSCFVTCLVYKSRHYR